MRRRLRWLGHLERSDDTRLSKCLLVCHPQGEKCSAGGQKMRWHDVVKRDLKKCNRTPVWHDKTNEGDVWREFVKDGAIELNRFMEVGKR